MSKVRIAVIGIGNRGMGAVARLFRIPDVEIVALSDLRESKTQWAFDLIRAHSKQTTVPKRFHGSPHAWRDALGVGFDLAYISTPWELHAEMGIAAMEAGGHAAIEVPICTSLEEAWALIRTAERTSRHCMMLENVCFGEAEMAVLGMCNAGILGSIVHAECAYLHDLRSYLVDPKQNYPVWWRLAHSQKRNGNLYPTHGLGPVSKYLQIGTADRMTSLVSISSRPAGIKHLIDTKHAGDPALQELSIRQGDVNTSIIQTRLGRTIMLQFSTGAPRPYSRLNMVQGTKGIFAGFPDRLALEPDPHHWNQELLTKYMNEFRATEWRHLTEEEKKNDSHGGMDTIMDRRLIRNLREGLPMDISVYESVLWSAIMPLSEQSVANGGSPVAIPDFFPDLVQTERK